MAHSSEIKENTWQRPSMKTMIGSTGASLAAEVHYQYIPTA
jgi:hypothetical protein